MKDHPSFIYNAFCSEQKKIIYNDLESFLINSSAFEKVLSNLDIELTHATVMREKLERTSRIFGAYRAADNIVKKKFGLSNSVLNGLEIKGFFNSDDISVDENLLKKSLPNWSNYKVHVDDLITEAERLINGTPALWSLSRGHDLTEMLALHFESLGNVGMRRDKIELMLRLACEFCDFETSPMGKKIVAIGATAWFAPLKNR